MIEFVAVLAWPLAAGAFAFTGFKAFEMYLAHREKVFVHKPLADMQRKLDELENKILSGVLRR